MDSKYWFNLAFGSLLDISCCLASASLRAASSASFLFCSSSLRRLASCSILALSSAARAASAAFFLLLHPVKQIIRTNTHMTTLEEFRITFIIFSVLVIISVVYRDYCAKIQKIGRFFDKDPR